MLVRKVGRLKGTDLVECGCELGVKLVFCLWKCELLVMKNDLEKRIAPSYVHQDLSSKIVDVSLRTQDPPSCNSWCLACYGEARYTGYAVSHIRPLHQQLQVSIGYEDDTGSCGFESQCNITGRCTEETMWLAVVRSVYDIVSSLPSLRETI